MGFMVPNPANTREQEKYFPCNKNISHFKGLGIDIFLKVTGKASVFCTQCEALACYGVAGKLTTEPNMLHLGQSVVTYTHMQTEFHL